MVKINVAGKEAEVSEQFAHVVLALGVQETALAQRKRRADARLEQANREQAAARDEARAVDGHLDRIQRLRTDMMGLAVEAGSWSPRATPESVAASVASGPANGTGGTAASNG